ncbi:MAG: hypothetical protein U0166_14550 [Acidobacteriota bacterium]
MKKLALVPALALAAAPALADDRFRADVSVGFADISGSYESSEEDATIPSVDLDGDLGISGSNSALQARLWGKISKHHRLQLDAFDVDDSGHSNREVPVTILGVPFPVEALIDSTFSITYVRATYGWAPIASDRADVELQVGLERCEASSTIHATDAILGIYSANRSDSRSEVGPVLGAHVLLYPIKRLELEGYLTYAWLPISGTDIKFDDALVAAAFHAAGPLWVRAGYRIVDVNVDDPNFKADLSSHGPFAGVVLKF